MKDFLGNDLNFGDEIIYIKSLRTGSSTTRNVLFKGRILDFLPKNVEILRTYSNEEFPIEIVDVVKPGHVCKLNPCKGASK